MLTNLKIHNSLGRQVFQQIWLQGKMQILQQVGYPVWAIVSGPMSDIISRQVESQVCLQVEEALVSV